ncbi:MAG: NTP transferase domain-containing protein [Gammaproteobacteria bacterium]
MSKADPGFRAVVLAGERPGGSALTRAAGVASGVLVPVAGQTAVERVVNALDASPWIRDCCLCGPAPSIAATNDVIKALAARQTLRWLAPASGPAASALAAVESINEYPILVTAGDHALLSVEILDEFCASTSDRSEDLLIGLVPYDLVRAAFPESRRTVLRFRDGGYCGSNLFAIMKPAAGHALRFWSQVEKDRKRPWKIARQLGLWTLLKYLSGRCSVEQAFRILSSRAGCRVGFIRLETARAAVDVDSVDDWHLAEQILGAAEPNQAR